MKKAVIPISSIESRIYTIRGQRVMLDSDLAELYGVETRVLIQAMNRNIERFPSDFMFRLSKDEYENLRSQIVTSSSVHGGRRYPPYVFTEHGTVMLASVLNSQQAVEASIFVVRAFVRLREFLFTHKELAGKLAELESKMEIKFSKHDKEIQAIIEAIHQLMRPPVKPKKQIGFRKER